MSPPSSSAAYPATPAPLYGRRLGPRRSPDVPQRYPGWPQGRLGGIRATRTVAGERIDVVVDFRSTPCGRDAAREARASAHRLWLTHFGGSATRARGPLLDLSS